MLGRDALAGVGDFDEIFVTNIHNTSEVLFRLCANTDPQGDSLVAVRQDSPNARPTCSTTPPVPRMRDHRQQTGH